jgi:predicted methyltransferase
MGKMQTMNVTNTHGILLLATLVSFGCHATSLNLVSLENVLAQPDRLPADVVRDGWSKPEEVVPYLNLRPGTRVLELFASGGYYSELIARVVGPTGEVLLHNTEGFRAWGINKLNRRFGGRTPPTALVQYDREISELGLGEGHIDAVIVVMALHDLYVVPKRYDGARYVVAGDPADAAQVLRQIFVALRPGGRFVVIDHDASQELTRDEAFEMHRMHEQFAKFEIEAVGFKSVAASSALKNTQDDGLSIVFDWDKGQTSRFVLVFEKP